jgi:NAD(P)-dependent dehydrogenase (short-subunit alcohol dehydrogenase family)
MKAMIDASPVNRDGTANDIANAATFLCITEAVFSTGTYVLVYGGIIDTFAIRK